MLKKILVYFMLFLTGVGMVHAEPAKTVYWISIKGEINSAVAAYVQESVKEAEKNNASQIVFEIDTYGGSVDSAIKISDTILNTLIPNVCYIKENAISAGVIIAISGDRVVADRSINIGSAETRPKEEKYISFWAGKLRSVAKQQERNPEIIAGMADADVEIPGVKEKGKLINFTADEALKYKVVDKVVNTKAELFEYIDTRESDIIALNYDLKTNISRFTSNPYVATLLVTIGIIGIVAEIFTAGFGLFGSVAVLSFAIFIAGSFFAGYTKWWELILILAGVLLLGFEITVPGFGIPGITGALCLVLGVILASPNVERGVTSLVIALVIGVVGSAVLLKYAPRSKYFDRIILNDTQKNEMGYVSQQITQDELLGLEGEAITQLRPAGTVLIEDKKIDVVSDGEFIAKGSRIKIEAVDGNRVVVRKV